MVGGHIECIQCIWEANLFRKFKCFSIKTTRGIVYTDGQKDIKI